MQSVNPEPYLLSKGWALKESSTQYILDCPLCGKENHFYINKNNGLWDCKVCGEAGNLYQLRQRLGDTQPPEIQSVKPPTPNSLPNITVAHNRLMHNEPAALDYLVCDRKLTMSVIERFQLGVREQYFSNKLEKECKALVIPYFRSGKLVYAKYRSLPPEEKDFSNSGGSIDYLFNHDAIRNGMDELVICEAEIDAMSLLSIGYESVVAIPGVGTQKTLWVKSIDVAAPKKIFICLDSDEAGQKAAKELAEKIGIDKCYNIVLPYKDVNECLVNGLTLEQFDEIKANAKKFDVAGIVGIPEVVEQILIDIDTRGGLKPEFDTPWPSLNNMVGGFDYGDLIGVLAKAKAGKCLTQDTYVATASGYTTIGNILKLPELPTLVNQHGALEQPTHLLSNGVKTTLTLTTRSGFEIRSTDNHPHLVMGTCGEHEWKESKDLQLGDFLCTSRYPIFGTKTCSFNEAYALGILIADGQLLRNRIAITNDDPCIKRFIETELSSVLGTEWLAYPNNTTGSTNYHFNSKDSAQRFYDRYGLAPVLSKNKSLPEFVMQLDRNSLTYFLQGYFDCECSLDDSRLEVTSASKILLRQVKLILTSFGITCQLSPKKVKKYPNNLYYRLGITGTSLVKYLTAIGFHSCLRQNSPSRLVHLTSSKNTNVDIVPYQKQFLETWNHKNPRSKEVINNLMEWGTTKQLTYARLSKNTTKIQNADVANHFDSIKTNNYFYDPITKIELGPPEETYDFHMPKSHSFIANGVVTHNSTLALNMLEYYTAKNYTTLMFCLEMPPKKLVRKWISLVTETPDSHNDSKITKDTIQRALKVAVNRQSELLFGFTKSFKPEDIFSTIRQAVRRYGAKVVCFDNLHLLVRSLDNSAQEISNLTKQFKELAMSLNILILLIVQPTKVKDGEIISSDNARGSAAIQQDVDGMLVIHRNPKVNLKDLGKLAEVHIEENLDPTMFIRASDTRYASGGICTLKLVGELSKVCEINYIPNTELPPVESYEPPNDSRYAGI